MSGDIFECHLLGGDARQPERDARRDARRQRRRSQRAAAQARQPAPASGKVAARTPPATPADRTRFVRRTIAEHTSIASWNAGRAAEHKTAAIERLMQHHVSIIALQEIGGAATAENSTLSALCKRLNYTPYIVHRRHEAPAPAAPAAGAQPSSHGGVALLVAAGITAKLHKWTAAADWPDCDAVCIEITPTNGAPPFLVSSLYVRGSSTDVVGFRNVLFSSQTDNMIIATDANAEPARLADGKRNTGGFTARRGAVLDDFVEQRDAFCPTPTAPTRPKRIQENDTCQRDVITGSYIDHIIVGADVANHITSSDLDAVVLEDFPSDHRPLVWSGSLGIKADSSRPWHRRVAWDRITAKDTLRFNEGARRYMDTVRMTRRDYTIDVVEQALLSAQRALPFTKPPRGPPPGLFWNAETASRVDAAIDKHGNGAVAEITKSFAQTRRETLAKAANVTADPTSCWGFVSKYYGFKRRALEYPPLATDAADTFVTKPADRVEVLGKQYARVHDDPSDRNQDDLKATVDRLREFAKTPDHSKPVKLVELRAAIAETKTGKCADSLGLRSEHLHLLDDKTLEAMLPFFDRQVRNAAFPKHWRCATTTPVAKRARDLSKGASWRPVSVTPIVCRLTERIMFHRIMPVVESLRSTQLGQSQFGFRRGISTTLPLSGLAMFVADGFNQQTLSTQWDAAVDGDKQTRREYGSGEQAAIGSRHHSTLLASIDASDAFCRAATARAVHKLIELGLIVEARWVAAFLIDRTMIVKEGVAQSQPFGLARGAPQGSILAPLLWALVLDDLVQRLEQECRRSVPGCIVVPIIFADDINFALRGFNPTSLVERANQLLAIVKEWSVENGIPMSKLSATFLTNGAAAPPAAAWPNGTRPEIKFDDNLKCEAGIAPLKLLGVTFNTAFNFHDHVDDLVTKCESYLRFLSGMRGVVSAEKLLTLYRGLILSRLLYAVDVWYPHTTIADRRRLQQIHYRACCIVCDVTKLNAHNASVCYEAGLRTFDELAQDEVRKLADRLRRMPDDEKHDDDMVFGTEWVVRLFRDRPMPTAKLRDLTCAGYDKTRGPSTWPPQNFNGRTHGGRTLRDIARALPPEASGRRADFAADPRKLDKQLRPLPRIHPFSAQELGCFDEFVRFHTSPPGGLIKLHKPLDEWTPEEMAPYRAANERRMLDLSTGDPIFVFTDGARTEASSSTAEAAVGYYVICDGPVPRTEGSPEGPRNIVRKAPVPVPPIACIYSAELGAITAALQYVADNISGFKGRKLVLITDSKSSLEAMQVSWLRRMGHLEQDATRHLHRIAAAHIHVHLAFVFSHVGGVAGNDLVDLGATKACKASNKWTGSSTLWHVDSTRRILQLRHAHVDSIVAYSADYAVGQRVAYNGRPPWSFRFLHAPACAPSAPLPRGMARSDERLVYRARLGIISDVGGVAHGSKDVCPFCRNSGKLGRGGKTVTHVAACTAQQQHLALDTTTLWRDPPAAAATLANISAEARRIVDEHGVEQC